MRLSIKISKISSLLTAIVLAIAINNLFAEPQSTKTIEVTAFTPKQASEYDFTPQIVFIRDMTSKKTIRAPIELPLLMSPGKYSLRINCANQGANADTTIKQSLIENTKYLAYCKTTVKRGSKETGSIISIDAYLIPAASFSTAQAAPTVID